MKDLKYKLVSVVKKQDDLVYETLRENLTRDRDFILCGGYRIDGVNYNQIATYFDFDENVCILYVAPVKPL